MYITLSSEHVVSAEESFSLHSNNAYLVSFTFPASITNTTSGIVIPVSAMFVAMTTLRTPEGGIPNAEL